MAILKSVVNVNNGNTGWTRQNVLDALETTFANLGFNGGSAIAGSPVFIQSPQNSANNQTGFRFCGGPSTYVSHSYQTQRHFEVTNNGTSSYNFRENFYTSSSYLNMTTDVIRIDFGVHGDDPTYDHGIQTGDPLVYGSYDTFIANWSTITGLTWGTTYYAIRVDRRDFKLAATAEDATNGIAVNLTAWVNGTSYPFVAFRRPFNVLYNNYEIVVKTGTKLNFYVNDTTSGGTFNIISNPELGYSTTRIFNSGNYTNYNYREYPIGNATSVVSWSTRAVALTENEFFSPQELNNLGIGNSGKVSYGYVNSSNPTMKGNIVILPNANSDQWNYGEYNYFKYTVPASGNRSALKLKIYRYGHEHNSDYRGKISNITIHSIASGWVEGDTFTIPGSAVGGVDGTHDILFSTTFVSTDTQATSGTGTCKIYVTNYGAINKMYQKSNGGIVNTITFTNATGGTGYTAGTNLATTGGTGSALRVNTTVTGGVIQTVAISNAGSGYTVGDVITITGGDGLATFTIATVYGHGHFAVLKSVNDATKDFGTTYYGIGLHSNNYTMNMKSGVSWLSLNTLATNAATYNAGYSYGYWGGDRGLDYQENNNYIMMDDSYSINMQYASTSTPTAYPLSIRTYKAQSPQDSNFVIIQFTQTINNVIIPFATFSLNKGPNHGANIWDLNHVWNGAYTTYMSTTRGIQITSPILGTRYYYDGAGAEPLNTRSLAREANYGFFRDGYNSYYNQDFGTTTYDCNIDTKNLQTSVIAYYRNNNYDKFTSPSAVYENNNTRMKSVSTAANFYKPMKGVPISNRLMPCPYYLPDDYVMLQVATSPGLTQFRPGDTVTVSAGEVYEIIISGYEQQQNGLDDIPSNQTIGMLFCARTT